MYRYYVGKKFPSYLCSLAMHSAGINGLNRNKMEAKKAVYFFCRKLCSTILVYCINNEYYINKAYKLISYECFLSSLSLLLVKVELRYIGPTHALVCHQSPQQSVLWV